MVTNKTFDEKRVKGLCFWCNEKYSPGHKCKNKCKKKQAFVLHLQLNIEEEEEKEIAKKLEELDEYNFM